jgi:hypothetical protein
MSRQVITSIGLFVVGIGLIVWGAIVQDSSYLSNLLATAGMAALLVVPLLLVERLIEKRVNQVGAQVKQGIERSEEVIEKSEKAQEAAGRALMVMDTRLDAVQEAVNTVESRLNEIDRQTEIAIDESQRNADAEVRSAAKAIADEATQESLVAGIQRAMRDGVLDDEGGNTESSPMRLWFATMLPDAESGAPSRDFTLNLWIGPPDENGSPTVAMQVSPSVLASRYSDHRTPVRTDWASGTDVSSFFVELNSNLRRTWGDKAPRVQPGPVLGRISSALEHGHTRQAALGEGQQWSLGASLSDSWLLHSNGMLQRVGSAEEASIFDLSGEDREVERREFAKREGMTVTEADQIVRAGVAFQAIRFGLDSG